MNDILQAIYGHFYTFPRHTPEENHQRLIKRLRKQERKLVLRIIDDKDFIANAVSLDSFIQGFRLAWMLSNQINSYGGYPFDDEIEQDVRRF